MFSEQAFRVMVQANHVHFYSHYDSASEETSAAVREFLQASGDDSAMPINEVIHRFAWGERLIYRMAIEGLLAVKGGN